MLKVLLVFETLQRSVRGTFLVDDVDLPGDEFSMGNLSKIWPGAGLSWFSLDGIVGRGMVLLLLLILLRLVDWKCLELFSGDNCLGMKSTQYIYKKRIEYPTLRN